MDTNTSKIHLEDTRFTPGQTPEVGHKRSLNILLEEGSARHQTCIGEESLERCARKQRAGEICMVVASDPCCGNQNKLRIQQSGWSAVARFEPAAWKETPAEHREWIAMFDFLSI